MPNAKIEDAIHRVLQGLERYRNVAVPPPRGPRLGSPIRKPWTDERRDHLIAMFIAGVPRCDMAGHLGTTVPAIENKLKRLGLSERARKRARMETRHAA